MECGKIMKPMWLRVNPAIRSFILGEVERQYHPIGTMEFATRVEWMTDAWMWAMEQDSKYPTMDDMLYVASIIEPEMNGEGFRRHGVWIGNDERMQHAEVPAAVARLWARVRDVVPRQGKRGPARYLDGFSDEGAGITADEFYLEFEYIHPFGDGNGRTGKIIHNWLLGTLKAPVLVADYFGGGNP